jgi:acetolactate synthase I/II/III large subunit
MSASGNHDRRRLAAKFEMTADDAIVTGDAGDFSGPFAVHIRFRDDRRFLGPTSGSMAYGLSAAVGAKSIAPHRPVVALAGDGGFMMAVQELETAVRYDLPVVAVVSNNNLHGSIARHQRANFGGRLFGTELGNPDCVAMARAFGANGFRVQDEASLEEDFEAAVVEALASDAPSVVEIVM